MNTIWYNRQLGSRLVNPDLQHINQPINTVDSPFIRYTGTSAYNSWIKHACSSWYKLQWCMDSSIPICFPIEINLQWFIHHTKKGYLIGVALYHTSTYILTYCRYVTRLADPRPFHGFVYVYGFVCCTSTRYHEHHLISLSTRLTPC